MDIKSFEKELDYCLKKLRKENDAEWIEIVDELGLDIHYDSLRKMAYGYQKYDEYIKLKELEQVPHETLNDINDKIIELKKERVKLCDTRTALNKVIREQARFESIVDMLKYEVSLLNDNKPLEEKYISFNEGNKQVVLCLSDIHYGLEVDNVWNKYNSEIARDRMQYLIGRTIDIVKTHNANMVNVVVLGDEIAGHLHVTGRLENSESTTEQIIGVSELIAEGLNLLANNVPYVSVGFVNGNHSRVFADKNQNTNRDYMTSLVKEFIKLRVGHRNNVVVLENNVSNDMLTLSVLGHEIVCVHGHNDKVNNCLNRLNGMLGYTPKYVLMGHIHHTYENSDYNNEVIVSGSFAGSDEYSVSLRLHNNPIQKVLVFDKKYGRECTYNIDLSVR